MLKRDKIFITLTFSTSFVTAGSATGLGLVRSICRQIHFLLDHPLKDSASLLTADYDAAVAHFHSLMRGVE